MMDSYGRRNKIMKKKVGSSSGQQVLTVDSWSRFNKEAQMNRKLRHRALALGESPATAIPQASGRAGGGNLHISSALESLLNLKEDGGGKTTISVKTLVNLLRVQDDDEDVPPQTFVITRASIDGAAERGGVRLDTTFHIRVLADEWVICRLLPDTLSVSETEVEMNVEPVEGKKTACGEVAVQNRAYCLFASRRGRYVVHLKALAPYQSERARGIRINVPYAVRNSLSFRVNEKDQIIVVDPALGKPHYHEDEKDGTKISCEYTPTEELSIQWKKVEEDELIEDVPEEEDETLVYASLSTLISVGEGVCQTSTAVDYQLVGTGTCSIFEVFVPSRVRVTSLEGAAVRRWVVKDKEDLLAELTLKDVPKEEEEGEKGKEKAEVDLPEGYDLLRVFLDYPVENKYSLRFACETSLGGTSVTFKVPTFRCKNINRERGFIAVEARTSVEIAETRMRGVAVVSPSDLPSELRSRSSNPILLGYKFLNTAAISVVLNVKKHEDAAVLIAIADMASFQATVSEQKTIYHLRFRIRNTQAQYLRIDAPSDCVVWSTTVGGRPVKPALDTTTTPVKGSGGADAGTKKKGLEDMSDEDEDHKTVMIPLEKSGQGEANAFEVEIVYVTAHSELPQRGHMNLFFPKVHIPINHLFFTAYMPDEGYVYGEWTGDLREGMRGVGGYYSPGSGHPAAQVLQTHDMFLMDNVSDQMGDYDRMRSAPQGVRRGVIPVQVTVPTTSQGFHFQRLLVVNQSFRLQVPYKRVGRGWRDRRSLGGCCVLQ